MTNEELIRQMSTDELVEFIENVYLKDVDMEKTFCELCTECDRSGCIRFWLEQDTDMNPWGYRYQHGKR